MNDNLSNALAGLAESLGITVSQLWDWMQGSGLKAYATSKVVTLATTNLLLFMVAVALPVMMCFVYKAEMRRIKNATSVYDKDFGVEAFGFILTAGIIDAFCAITLAFTLPDLLGWIVSPEGMLIQELMGRL